MLGSFIFLILYLSDNGESLEGLNVCEDRKIKKEYCCSGYEETNGICIECNIGFQSIRGRPCLPCLNNRFGERCLSRCNCQSEERCDNERGCESKYNHSEFLLNTTRTTEDNSSYRNKTFKLEILIFFAAITGSMVVTGCCLVYICCCKRRDKLNPAMTKVRNDLENENKDECGLNEDINFDQDKLKEQSDTGDEIDEFNDTSKIAAHIELQLTKTINTYHTIDEENMMHYGEADSSYLDVKCGNNSDRIKSSQFAFQLQEDFHAYHTIDESKMMSRYLSHSSYLDVIEGSDSSVMLSIENENEFRLNGDINSYHYIDENIMKEQREKGNSYLETLDGFQSSVTVHASHPVDHLKEDLNVYHTIDEAKMLHYSLASSSHLDVVDAKENSVTVNASHDAFQSSKDINVYHSIDGDKMMTYNSSYLDVMDEFNCPVTVNVGQGDDHTYLNPYTSLVPSPCDMHQYK